MRINNTYLSGLTVSWVEGPPLQPRGPRRTGKPGDAAQELGAHLPSPELVHWTTLAAGEPEIRAELLKTVVERLAQRFYLTPASAEQTAEAMIQAEE